MEKASCEVPLINLKVFLVAPVNYIQPAHIYLYEAFLSRILLSIAVAASCGDLGYGFVIDTNLPATQELHSQSQTC